jgi:hypothetical protein
MSETDSAKVERLHARARALAEDCAATLAAKSGRDISVMRALFRLPPSDGPQQEHACRSDAEAPGRVNRRA